MVRQATIPAGGSNGSIGGLTTLYTASDKGPLKGPNDLAFDADGGFYFTDHGKMRPREMDRGAVCYARIDGSHIHEVIGPVHSPNGIGISPDGKTIWVAETFTCRLWAFRHRGTGQHRAATLAAIA